MSKKRRNIIIFIAVLTAVLLTGCLNITADDLFSLPEIAPEHLRLQAHINILTNQGAEFAPPSRGPNRQAVQLVDLNGTGTSEVIAFFSIPEEGTLRVYIFEMYDGDYVVASTIEGIGTEIDSVRYVDMDGDGIKELVIGWQMGALRYMSIYTLQDFHVEELVSRVEYSEIAISDITGDETDDIIVFRLPTHDAGAVAEVYSLMQDGEVVREEARLSNAIESITRIQTGRLIDGSPAIFVDSEGTFESGSLVTDVLVMSRDGEFSNISMESVSGISESTIRHRMASTDINNDGILKVPSLRLLATQSETEYFAIDWYTFRNSGERVFSLTTYHNTFDEWFLILPVDWRDNISVRREDSIPGERTIIFSYYDRATGEHESFLKVFRLSGENAAERASTGGRELLTTAGASAYAFEIIAPPDSFGLTFNDTIIRENFRLIYSDWLAGSAT